MGAAAEKIRLSGKGLGINKISHHPEMLPGNEFPGCYVPSLRDFYMSCKDIS